MTLETFFTDRIGAIVSKGSSHTPLKIGTEVLVVNSHVNGRYTCVGIYAGRPKEICPDIKVKSDGHNNIILDNTFTLPIEVELTNDLGNHEYHIRVVQTIKERGLNEGKTLHALDLGTEIYRVK